MSDAKQVMSAFKALHWKEQFDAWKCGELVYPRLLQLDPVAGCNHSCPFCYYRAQSDEEANANFNEADIVSFDNIVEILSDAREMGIKAVELTGGGEPALHPKFLDITRTIHDMGFDLGLITNGTGKNFRNKLPEMVEQLKRAEWVRFSINGGIETHKVVHRGRKDDYEVVLESVRALCDAKSSDMKVGISFIVWESNYEDIASMVDTAQNLGCDYIRFAPALFGETTGLKNLHNEISDYQGDTRKIIEKILFECKENFDISIIDEFSFRLNHRISKDYYEDFDFCYISEVVAVVGADLGLYPCCVKKYTTSGFIGSLSNIGLKQLWESEERQEYYAKMNIRKMCGTCHFKPKNDLIKYMVDTEPLHLNFI